MRQLGIAVGIALAALGARPADAMLFELVAQGTVTAVNASPLGGLVSVGDPFTVTALLDSSVLGVPTGGNVTEYAGSVVAIDVIVGAATGTLLSPLPADVTNDGLVGDEFSLGGFVTYGGANETTILGLRDSAGTVFSDGSFPTSLDLADFDAGSFVVFQSPLEQVFGDITSLTYTPAEAPIPEPSTALLLGLGLGGLATRCRAYPSSAP